MQNLNNYAHCPLFFNGCHNSHGHIIFLKNSPKKHMQTLISTYYNITHLIANVQLPFYLNPTSMLCLMPIFHIFVIPIPQSQHDDPCFFIWMHITCHFHIFIAFLSWCTYKFLLHVNYTRNVHSFASGIQMPTLGSTYWNNWYLYLLD